MFPPEYSSDASSLGKIPESYASLGTKWIVILAYIQKSGPARDIYGKGMIWCEPLLTEEIIKRMFSRRGKRTCVVDIGVGYFLPHTEISSS